MKTEDIPLKRIRLDGGTQPRVKIDQDTVADHKAGYELGEERPALDVFWDGTDYWLADGFHRWHGANQAKLEDHTCIVHQGTQRDAILFSVGANGKHGLRRTNEDKRKAVETLLNDKEWGERSQNWIAEKCGVSSGFVSDIVAQLPLNGSCRRPEKTKGKDGRVRAARKPSPNADAEVATETRKISGGTKFDPNELEDGPERVRPPKNGSVATPSYDDKKIDKPLGVIRRELDERLKVFPGTEREFRAAKHALSQFQDRLDEWRGAK